MLAEVDFSPTAVPDPLIIEFDLAAKREVATRPHRPWEDGYHDPFPEELSIPTISNVDAELFTPARR